MPVTLEVPQLPAPRDGNLCRRFFNSIKWTFCHVRNGTRVLSQSTITKIS